MLSAYSTTKDLISILSSVPPNAPMPEVYLENVDGEIEYEIEWRFSLTNYVMLNFGGAYGDGHIYSADEKEMKREDFSSSALYDYVRYHTDKIRV